MPEDECLANTRKGKQVLNVKSPAEAQVCALSPDDADHIAVIGENRKLLIFKRSEVPEMTRGKRRQVAEVQGGRTCLTRSASI